MLLNVVFAQLYHFLGIFFDLFCNATKLINIFHLHGNHFENSQISQFPKSTNCRYKMSHHNLSITLFQDFMSYNEQYFLSEHFFKNQLMWG